MGLLPSRKCLIGAATRFKCSGVPRRSSPCSPVIVFRSYPSIHGQPSLPWAASRFRDPDRAFPHQIRPSADGIICRLWHVWRHAYPLLQLSNSMGVARRQQCDVCMTYLISFSFFIFFAGYRCNCLLIKPLRYKNKIKYIFLWYRT